MSSSALISKGRVTVPMDVRDALALTAGDRLTFLVGPDGRVTIEPRTVDLLSLEGILEPQREGVGIEEMNEAVRRAGTRS